jgi:lipoate-protein ligase A
MRQWRLIYDNPTGGMDNMAVDDAILQAVSADMAPPTLRLYAWSHLCLTLGRGQKSTDVDFQRVAELGWEVVRRPSGGTAVLHEDELTYSLALPASHALARVDIVEGYRQISHALLAGLRLLGLAARADRMVSRPAMNSPVCFDIPSHYEVTVRGRKLVGSAQVRRKAGVLHHGSIPLDGDLGHICDGLAYPDETHREQAKMRVRARAITLSEASGQQAQWRTAAEAISQGFIAALEIDFEQETLSEYEYASAARLAEEVCYHIDQPDSPSP